MSLNRLRVHLLLGPLLGLFAGPPVALAGAPAPAPAPATGGATIQVVNLGEFRFESGHTLQDLQVTYVTYGRLNEAKDNVILALQHFVGDHRDLDFLIGPGMALDPKKYFIVATDFLGNSRIRNPLTTGPTNSGLKMAFPPITTRDWVKADYRLLKEHLGVDRVLAAVGASIGGMNAYQLAVSFPDFVKGIVAIAASPMTNPQTRLVLQYTMTSITVDSGWYGGNYETNPATGVNAALMHIVPWWYTPQWFADNVTTPQKHLAFQKYWNDIWATHAPQDARDIYYQLQGWASFNIGDTPGFSSDPRKALAAITARALLIAAKDDMLVRRHEVALAKEAIADARLVEIDSPLGHVIAIGGDPKATAIMNREIASFLADLR